MRLLLTTLSLSLFAVAACGDDAPPSEDPDAGDPDAGEPVACEASPGAITLRAVAVDDGAVPASRLVVVYYQFIDDVTPYPTPVIAHDQPLAALPAGGAACATIPLAEIEAPVDDPYLFCERACFDLENPACACTDGGGVATAFVLAVPDADESGAIEPDELDGRPVGVGYLGVATATEGYTASGWVTLLFPEGVAPGTQPYRVIPEGNDGFDALGLPEDDAVYDLHLCAPDAEACDLPVPNLT